jgi:CTP:molybdopterin cytidylyltransferase MocA
MLCLSRLTYAVVKVLLKLNGSSLSGETAESSISATTEKTIVFTGMR